MFPWVDILPADDRHQFAVEFGRVFETTADVERWNGLIRTVQEWKATAAVHADPNLRHGLSTPLDDARGPVPAPEASRPPIPSE